MKDSIDIINYLKVYRFMETWAGNGHHTAIPEIAGHFSISLLDAAIAFNWLFENDYVKFDEENGGLVLCR